MNVGDYIQDDEGRIWVVLIEGEIAGKSELVYDPVNNEEGITKTTVFHYYDKVDVEYNIGDKIVEKQTGDVWEVVDRSEDEDDLYTCKNLFTGGMSGWYLPDFVLFSNLKPGKYVEKTPYRNVVL